MKISKPSLNDQRCQHTEAIVTRHVHELFRRLPMLAGFWLRPDLKMGAELSVFDCSGFAAGRDLCELVMQSLAELAERRPEAVELMRGRTFARTVH